MNSFTFSYPTKVYFGEGSAAQAFRTELRKKGKTVLLAYGGGSVKKNGVYDEVKALLKQADKTIIDFSGIMPNPTYAKVQEGAAIAREQHVDFILAVGGGSVIDCCKVISAQALLDEDIWEMEYGKGQFPNAGIPVGAVVTASGTGAEMNAGGVIVPFPVSWTVKMKKKQKETQDILSYHSQAAGCSDKARAKASGGRQPIEECGRTGL